MSDTKIRTWKVTAPVGMNIVTSKGMNEAELTKFANQLVKEPKKDRPEKPEKHEDKPEPEAIARLRKLNYNPKKIEKLRQLDTKKSWKYNFIILAEKQQELIDKLNEK